ncbi:MAG: stage II sporulation protein P [Clostridiales bacterium]|nr:stage II sporulation protein P [Clostridiales bacterium]
MRRIKRIVLFVFNALFLWSIFSGICLADDWYEEESGYYTIVKEDENILTLMAREIFVDDEYISSDNRHYRVSAVDKEKRLATAIYLGDVELPHIEEVEDIETVSVPKEGNILLYCTHSAESYVPSDGAESIEGGGGILDVAESLQKNLEARGVSAYLDKTPHEPHDAAAYRRSRNTAIQLIQSKQPVAAIFDIHRDATPKEEYDLNLTGEPASRVRIVIGRGNQNAEANKELAYKIKAVADKTHPGLIKDVFLGKGMYNQELSPRSLLFEMGTHEIEKEAVEISTDYLAEVVTNSLFGGEIEAVEEQKPDEKKPDKKKPRKRFRTEPIKREETKSAGKGILWLAAVVVAGVIGFMLIRDK